MNILFLVKNMGLRYVAFRGFHELKKRSGVLKKQFPVNPELKVPISLEQWRSSKKPFFEKGHSEIEIDRQTIAEQAARIRKGEIKFFSNIWFNLGNDYDWITNPDTGFRYNINLHWTEINDYSSSAGDIKYIWEKSRFSYLYTLIRDEHWNGSQHAEFVFSEIENWIYQNPVNQGPNYKCSQEISIRVLNWFFALYYYNDSISLTKERWCKIINAIYWQMHHVYSNIHFSRIAVRNNHALTETLALYIVSTIFPWFNESAKWKENGKKWFEQEVAYQVYDDGSFLQFSMNYHRVIIQLLTWALMISELNEDAFSDLVYEKAYKSLNFLYQCQEGSNGELPNYGANDGALFFPLNSSDFRDYRPQLNALHLILCGTNLYSNSLAKISEDAFWFGVLNRTQQKYSPLKKIYGCISFDTGGYYLIRDSNTFTFIRCGDHNDRPSQADNLHIDIWVNGNNVFIDGGSYKYNTDSATLKYFMGSASHNIVMLDEHDQMKKGGRFIWYYWTQRKKAYLSETKENYEFVGSISAFRFLNKKIVHTRKVKKIKDQFTWQVEDKIEFKPSKTQLNQRWLLNNEFKDKVSFTTMLADPIRKDSFGFYSEKYGIKTQAKSIYFSTESDTISTTIKYKA